MRSEGTLVDFICPTICTDDALRTFSRRFRAVDVKYAFINIYQVPAFSRYLLASKRQYLKNQNRRACDENLTIAL